MKKLLATLAFLLCASEADGQAYYQTVPNIATMQALGTSSPLFGHVTVQNNGAQGPNVGASNFDWTLAANAPGGACTPDGGTVFQATGIPLATGCWVKQFDYTFFNPYNWGAVSSPTLVSPIDSTTAFKNVLAAANPDPGGGSGTVAVPNSSILCPAGQWWLNNQITVGQGQGIYGVGSNRSCQFNASTTNATIQSSGLINIGGTGSISVFGPMVEQVMVNMNNQLGIAFYCNSCQDQSGFSYDFAYQVENTAFEVDGASGCCSVNTYTLTHDAVLSANPRTAGGDGILVTGGTYPGDMNALDVDTYTGHAYANEIHLQNLFNFTELNTTLEVGQKIFSGTQSGTVLTINNQPSGNNLSVGDVVSGTGIPTGSETITSFATGSGGAGSTANVTQTASIGPETMQANSGDTTVGLWDDNSCTGHIDGITTQYVPTAIKISTSCSPNPGILVTALATNLATTAAINNVNCGPVAQTITDNVVGFYYCGNKAYFDVTTLQIGSNVTYVEATNSPLTFTPTSSSVQTNIRLTPPAGATGGVLRAVLSLRDLSNNGWNIYNFGDGTEDLFMDSVVTGSATTVFDLKTTGLLKLNGGVSAGGSTPTASGTCTHGTQAGGNTAGTIVLTCTAQTITLTFAATAPNGWECEMQDRTTPADLIKSASSTTTSWTSASSTTAANDGVSFMCMAY